MSEIVKARSDLIDSIVEAAKWLHDPYFGEIQNTRDRLHEQFAAYEKAILEAATRNDTP